MLLQSDVPGEIDDIEESGGFNTDFKSGVPTLGKKAMSDTAKTYYNLGRASASLDQKRETIKQQMAVSIMQMAMLQKTKEEIQNSLMVGASQNAALNAKLQMLMGGGQQPFPPLGGQQGMPPDLQQGVPQGSPQGMPPDMMGGQQPQMGMQ